MSTIDITQPTPGRQDARQVPTIRLTDAGLETVLIFDEGFDLPEFAAFPLVQTDLGRAALDRYYRAFFEMAAAGAELVVDTPTWRASTAWGAKLGFDENDLDAVNAEAVEFVQGIRASVSPDATALISGCVGSRTDGYRADDQIGVAEAATYHARQIGTLAAAGVDVVTALTMTYAAEAAGVARAARDVGVPVVVSFTVETDGRLPSGETLQDAIEFVDADTDGYVTHFGVNCAHPDHFSDVLDPEADFASRIGLVRSNASRLSHAELDEAEELDAGDPDEWGSDVAALRHLLPSLQTVGGCCGTSHEHIAAAGAATGVIGC